MKTRALFVAVLMFFLMVSVLPAAELAPYLTKTGIGGVDIKVYGLTSTTNDILMSNKLPPGYLPVEVPAYFIKEDTYTYSNSGYILKASFRPPILGLELMGKIGTVSTRYEINGSTAPYAESDRTGIMAGLGLRKKIIGEVGILPQVAVGVEASGTYAEMLNPNGTALVANSRSLQIDLQASIVASKEFMIRLKKPSKGPAPVTGLPEVPEPVPTPEQLMVPLCFTPPAGENLSGAELALIGEYVKKGLKDSGKIQLTPKEELDKVIEGLEYQDKSHDLEYARAITGKLGTRYAIIGAVSKSDEGVYVAVINLVDAEAIVEEEKEEAEEEEGTEGEKEEEKDDEEDGEVKEVIKGKIIYSGTLTFENIEEAGEAVNGLLKEMFETRLDNIYEINKIRVIEEMKREMLEGKLKEDAEKKEKDTEKKLKKEQKNAFKLLFVPYGGLKYGYRFFGRYDKDTLTVPLTSTTIDEIFTGSTAGASGAVVGLKFKFMNFLSMFVEAGFNGETVLAGGLSIGFGL